MTAQKPIAAMSSSEPPPDLHELDPADLLARAVDTVRPTGSAGGWTPPTPEELAQMLPQYRIESLLGRGGMGAVYKCWQPSLERPVAIKLLPAEFALDAVFVARFQREARTLAKLQHPRIITIHDFGQTSDGNLYFVMEYIDGTDLRKVLRGPGLAPEQALAVVGQLCDALQAAHRVGIVHRDIKPENVLITSDGYVKLADFGLAQPPREDGATILTGTNVVMGTPSYMAPEQFVGGAKADPRSDIFALGVMFYEMLTGQRPHGMFDPPSQKVQVDVRIDAVVLRALQSEPDRRYQQASEFRSDIDEILTTPAEPAPHGESAPLPSPSEPSAPARGYGRVAVRVFVVVLLGALAAFAWLRFAPHAARSSVVADLPATPASRLDTTSAPEATPRLVTATPTPPTVKPAATPPPIATPFALQGDTLTPIQVRELRAKVEELAANRKHPAFDLPNLRAALVSPRPKISLVRTALSDELKVFDSLWRNTQEGYLDGRVNPDGRTVQNARVSPEIVRTSAGGPVEYTGQKPRYDGAPYIGKNQVPQGGMYMRLMMEVYPLLYPQSGSGR